MSVDCGKCRHFQGYDGVGELWTCCRFGDFKGEKKSCKHFQRPGALLYLVIDEDYNKIALFFEKASANCYVKDAKKECKHNDLQVIEKQLKIKEVL